MFKTSDYRTRHKHWPSLPDPREVRDGVVQRQHVANEQANQTAFGTAFAWLSCQRDLPPSQGQCVPALLGARGTVKLLRSAAVKRHSCCEGCCICFSLFGFGFNWRLFNCMGTKQKKKKPTFPAFYLKNAYLCEPSCIQQHFRDVQKWGERQGLRMLPLLRSRCWVSSVFSVWREKVLKGLSSVWTIFAADTRAEGGV